MAKGATTSTPPTAAAPSAWGLEIGGSAARLVRVTRGDSGGGGARIETSRHVELASRWTDAIDWPAVLRELEVERVDGPLVVALPDEQMLYRRIELPPADDAALDQLVDAQAEARLPLSRDALALGWTRLANEAAAGGTGNDAADEASQSQAQSVLICATRREHVQRITSALPAHCRDVTFAPSGLALAAGWSQFHGPADAPRVLVDVAARHTSVIAIDAHGAQRIAVLDEGADHWTEELADALQIAPDRAEALKHVLMAGESAGDHSDEQMHTAAATLGRAIEGWMLRLGEMYRSAVADLAPARQPQRGTLLGRGAPAADVREHLSQRLGLTFDASTDADNTGNETSQSWTAAGGALHALGMAASAVRLVEPAPEQKASRRRAPMVWAALIAWLLIAVGALYAMDMYRAQQLETAVERMRAQSPQNAQDDRASARGRYLRQQTIPAIAVLGELAAVTPREILLTGWDYSNEPRVRLRATVDSADQAGKLYAAVQQSELFESADLVRLNQADRRQWEVEIEAEPVQLFRYIPARHAADMSSSDDGDEENGDNGNGENGNGDDNGNEEENDGSPRLSRPSAGEMFGSRERSSRWP